MSSPAANKSFTVRASAIPVVTTGENNTDVALNKAWGSGCTLLLDYTIADGASIIFTYYASTDQATYVPIETVGGGVLAHTVTATGTKVVNIDAPGFAYLRVNVTGVGTLTNCLAAVTARFNTRAV